MRAVTETHTNNPRKLLRYHDGSSDDATSLLLRLTEVMSGNVFESEKRINSNAFVATTAPHTSGPDMDAVKRLVGKTDTSPFGPPRPSIGYQEMMDVGMVHGWVTKSGSAYERISPTPNIKPDVKATLSSREYAICHKAYLRGAMAAIDVMFGEGVTSEHREKIMARLPSDRQE